jgi:hypothetical protein
MVICAGLPALPARGRHMAITTPGTLGHNAEAVAYRNVKVFAYVPSKSGNLYDWDLGPCKPRMAPCQMRGRTQSAAHMNPTYNFYSGHLVRSIHERSVRLMCGYFAVEWTGTMLCAQTHATSHDIEAAVCLTSQDAHRLLCSYKHKGLLPGVTLQILPSPP